MDSLDRNERSSFSTGADEKQLKESIGHTVPYGTDLLVAGFQAINCQATIIRSLRDKPLLLSPFLSLFDGSFQNEFDLAVDAPELFLGPSLEIAPKLFVDPQ